MAKEYTGGSVSYYKVHVSNPTTIAAAYDAECNDIIEALGMNYAEGNAFKAIWRSCAARSLGLSKQGYTDGLYDAEKALFFSGRMVKQAASEQCQPAEEVRNTGGVINNNATYIIGEGASEQLAPNNSIPSWARWIAIDENGGKFCYENMPEIDEEHPDNLCWFCNSGKEQFLGNVKKPFNARTTLLSLDQQ